MSYRKELVELAKYLRKVVITWLVVFSFFLILPLVYRKHLDLVFSLALKPLGTELIAGTVLGPLTAYILISLTYSIIFSSPAIIYLTYDYLKPALYESERRVVKTYFIIFGIVILLAFPFSSYIVYPAFIRFSVLVAELLKVKQAYLISSIIETFTIAYVLTVVTLLIPPTLHIILKYEVEPFYSIVADIIKERSRYFLYVGLYFIFAILTPGDVVFITAIYTGIVCLGSEVVIRLNEKKIRR